MSIFIDEILEQPQVLYKTLNFYLDSSKGGKILELARKLIVKKKISHIIYSGMGSSFFNSQISYYYLNNRGFSCDVRESGEFYQYLLPPGQIKSNELLIGVSQSGESGELVKLIQLWKEKNFDNNLFAITNTLDSTLAKSAILTIPTLAEKETSVTSKTYSTGLLVHYLLARAFITDEFIPVSLKNEINAMILNIESILSKDQNLLYKTAKSIDEFMGPFKFINFIGNGTSMATVMQATLNTKEISKLYAEGITLGMFRHGPIEMIDSKFRCICIVNDEKSAQQMVPLIENITGKWGGGKVLVISNQMDIFLKMKSDKIKFIPNPVSNPYLAPIYEMVLLQPYLCYLAQKNGFVPGEFRNTQKITK